VFVFSCRPLNYLSIRWYKKPGASNVGRTPIVGDNIKYVISLYGRVLTVRDPTRRDSAVYECEAVFSRPGAQARSSSAVAEARLTVNGRYPVHFVICAVVCVREQSSTVCLLNIFYHHHHHHNLLWRHSTDAQQRLSTVQFIQYSLNR